MSNMLDWAKKEVELACKKENPYIKEGEFDYGCAIYKSALKAFESLCDDGHSGLSIEITKHILNRLIDGKPLTPIEDTDDIWRLCIRPKSVTTTYQCKRMSSLFKHVNEDGSVYYSSTDNFVCVNIHNPNNTYYSGLVARIVNEMFPITMPYWPDEKIKVFCEDFLIDRKNGDFDTVGIFYAIKKNKNNEPLRIQINRYFREQKEGEKHSWIEISKEEYEERKCKAIC